ncbi:SbcC/MukB-like Walker B domain-containing protein [Micromonospora orduensis]|uniref:SbcC/MukB-like Walker B domain-containing protein n=1 Tax=Micromonospora orduensis TaxID=1420891 RepID=UPI00382E976A
MIPDGMDQRPHPRSDRFRPSRAGIINLWDYTDEEFAFADGRLALRGANGSGKTKALEVVFPFVLDGSFDARRLDPFSGEERTMKSNLLYRGQDAAYGYVWMEFVRVDVDGRVIEAVTIGVGMFVRRHDTEVSRWYFVVDGRVGVDFGLLTRNDEPMSKKQLIAQLSPDAVYPDRTRYRAAVDARLFGLGPERYTQMVDLLLQLRRPLLAKDLDPFKVSDTLSAGLRPLDDYLIRQAAQSFDDLEGVQRELDTLAAASDAVRAFLADYLTYLRMHTRARLDAADGRAAAVADRFRQLVDAAREVHGLERRVSQAEEAVAEAEGECSRLTGHLDGLKNLDAYRHHGGLVQLRGRVQDTKRRVAAARTALERHDVQAGKLAADLDKSRGRLTDHSREAGIAARNLLDAAGRAGIEWDGDPLTLDGDVIAVTKARAATRTADLAAVKAELAEVATANQARSQAAEALAAAAARHKAAEEELAGAQRKLAAIRTQTHQSLAEWARRWTMSTGAEAPITDDDHQALARVIDRIGEPDAPRLPAAFAALTRQRREATSLLAHQLGEACKSLRKELTDEESRRAEIAAERDEAPAADPLRQAPRQRRPGGPLWQLVRFKDHVDDDAAAGVEAALHGAGLLTAWIHPSPAATVEDLAARRHDGYLLALPADRRPAGRTLADVLCAEDGGDVNREAIEAVLASISMAESTDAAVAAAPATTVTADGLFVQGVQVGALTKEAAEYIGPKARAVRRAARLADCDAAIARIREQLGALEERHRTQTDALEALDRAEEALPATVDLAKGARAVDTASGKISGTRQAVNEARTIHDGKIRALTAAQRRLRQVADEHAMPSDPQLIASVEQGVVDFVAAGPALHEAHRRVHNTKRDVDDRERLVEEHGCQREDLDEALRGESGLLAEITSALDTADADHGPEAAAVAHQVSRAEEQLRRAGDVREEARTALNTSREERAAAKQALSLRRDALTDVVSEHRRQLLTFAACTLTDLRPLLDITTTRPWPVEAEWPDPTHAARELAERVVQAVTDDSGQDNEQDLAVDVTAYVPSDALHLVDAYRTALPGRAPAATALQQSASRLSVALHELSDRLAACEQDYRLEWEQVDYITTVRVADADGIAPIATFAGRLNSRHAEQEVLLTERERAVLEDGILTGIAAQIHARTIAARDLVHAMDAATTSRRMSSGATVGISWVLANNLSDAQRVVAAILKKDAAHLGPDDLAALRGHFRAEIHAARARDRSQRDRRKSYHQLLTEVLDYRSWRTFQLKLIRPGGAEEILTKARHSVLSGGEKSASIHLPLFAAANAQYASAHPTCPRLIGLDEAFAGIDDKYKPELMGLTVAFDLDVIATGHDLWLTYPTVPAVAHYDLHHDEVAHAVSCMLLLWDGDTLHVDDGHASSSELAADMLGLLPTRHTPADRPPSSTLSIPDEDDFDDTDEVLP